MTNDEDGTGAIIRLHAVVSAKMHTLKTETSGFMVLMLIQLTFVLIFGLYVRYDEALLPAADVSTVNAENRTGERFPGVVFGRRASGVGFDLRRTHRHRYKEQRGI